ncbi:ActS/PrrB/RegB family redox-sensitive histidine kinase [Limimaricola sp. G21655-S1]|uniref:sensor histidine kinase RegB n=1 Tax=unclassified Limimaricola TaxID=2626459 RepID=UPI0022AF3E61|nr:ActS/PrrB/RegB family redox-sensitive histidine kinase [Limimaricola sp. G21655-S1]MCZ4261324.1 ActS/PrrB/RegB family redox-sensitive histidine kinase [Limimaricola sp. G21655-S1]
MPLHDSELAMLRDFGRRNRVRVRTQILLRWIALAGQTGAALVAALVYGLVFPTGLVAITIGVAGIANLLAAFLLPSARRLSEGESTAMLVFDIVQLSVLLWLTGGISNPFALLMLAPVTISATMLRLPGVLLVGGLALVSVTVLWLWSMPILSPQMTPLSPPELLRFGFWLALAIGITFIGLYVRRVTLERQAMGDALAATQLALAREQKLTDLGGVVAAAAHELGTPLATITLTASELADDLSDSPELAEDAALIRAQAIRCRDILRSMGRAGKEDTHLRQAPLEAVVREAAEPHLARGREVVFAVGAEPGAEEDIEFQPVIHRRPEIVHGLRNLIQNAVDFSAGRVEIDLAWTADSVMVTIEDDGPGFPPGLIERIGDPFMRSRRRPGYEGMGLGLFIAKTLLERSGARLSFANGGDRLRASGVAAGGAIVMVAWPRAALEAQPGANEPNPHFLP